MEFRILEIEMDVLRKPLYPKCVSATISNNVLNRHCGKCVSKHEFVKKLAHHAFFIGQRAALWALWADK
jgi:hypothetical protein